VKQIGKNTLEILGNFSTEMYCILHPLNYFPKYQKSVIDLYQIAKNIGSISSGATGCMREDVLSLDFEQLWEKYSLDTQFESIKLDSLK
jgi:hypothetical protein